MPHVLKLPWCLNHLNPTCFGDVCGFCHLQWPGCFFCAFRTVAHVGTSDPAEASWTANAAHLWATSPDGCLGHFGWRTDRDHISGDTMISSDGWSRSKLLGDSIFELWKEKNEGRSCKKLKANFISSSRDSMQSWHSTPWTRCQDAWRRPNFCGTWKWLQT